jgi:hypothetical protein
VARRESGKLDIYANSERVYTVEDPVQNYDFDMNYLYIRTSPLEKQ